MASSLLRNILRLAFSLLILLGIGSSSLVFSQRYITANGNLYGKVLGGGLAGTDNVILDPASFNLFNPGDTVLLIQMKGVESRILELPTYGSPTQLFGSPGKYEFLIILSTDNPTKTIRFRNSLNNTYDSTSDVQLVKIPSYYSVVINGPGFTCPAWDSLSGTGGVLAMIVRDTLTLNYDIDVSGKGFKGGAPVNGDGICTYLSSNFYSYNNSYTNSGLKGEGISSYGGEDMLTFLPIFPDYAKGKGANMTAGGGGSGMFSGGGGGANINNGGRGGLENISCGSTNQALGGIGGLGTKGTFLEGGRLFLGGGGGGSTPGTASAGGTGGGIIIILCKDLNGKGHTIRADGSTSAAASGTAGAGGGGAGGSIAIYLEKVTPSSTVTISASGGAGGNTNTSGSGEGGGGGGGLIWANIKLPASLVTRFVTGGLRGINGGLQNAGLGTKGDTLSTFIPVLNGFLFNSIHSSISGNLTDSICSNNTPYPILGTIPVGGTTPYSYLWQKSNNGVNSWSDISPSDVQNYAFPGSQPAGTFYIRRVVTDNSPTPLSDSSRPVKIIVQPRIVNNNIWIYSYDSSIADIICYNNIPKTMKQDTSILKYPSNTLLFTWQDSTSKVNRHWRSFYSGANDSIYIPSAGLDSTTWFRRIIVSGRCTDHSDSIKVTVLPVIDSNKISAAQEICYGMTFADLKQKAGSVLLGGDNTYRYKWQLSTAAAGPWGDATGTIDTSGYHPPTDPTNTEVKNYYRRIVSSGSNDVCRDTSSALLLTKWKKISNNLITSGDQTICSGSIPAIINANTPQDGDHVNYNRTWQQRPASGTFVTAGPNPVNQDNYQPAALTDTTWYRRYVTSGAGNVCKDSSNIVVVNVHKPIVNNKIALLSGLTDTTVCVSQLVPVIKGVYPSGGTNNIADTIYLWQVSTPGNNTWNTASGIVNGRSFTTGSLSNISVNPQLYYYRRSFTSGMCSTFSDTVSVKVLPKITNNTILADQAVCYSSAPALLTGPALSGGDPATQTWQWQQSIDAGTTWTSIISSDVQNYQPPGLTVPTGYRRLIFSGLSNCCMDSSNVVNMTINPLPVSVISPAIDTICKGTSKPFSLTISGSTSPIWNVTYKETYLKNNTSATTTVQENAASSIILVTPTIANAATDSASYSYTISAVTDNNLCSATSMTGSRKLVVYNIPVPNAGTDKSVCGQKHQLTGTTNFGKGRWFYPGVPVVDSTISGNSFTATVDSTLPGVNWTYPFEWKVINWTCPASAQVNITFYKHVSKADAEPNRDIFSFDGEDSLHAVAPVIGKGTWYSVATGDSVPGGLAKNLSTGANEFEWLVTNGACRDSVYTTLTVFNLKIPNGFSPNGDNINDVFEIEGLDTTNTEITLTIMNSAGTKVYHTDNKNGNTFMPWNGENEKGPLPDGTYYYVLTINSKRNNKTQPFQGFVLLKRDKNI
jgi:gliding motility-associated-like protein